MGCGLLNPIRATNLAMVGLYRYSLARPNKMQRKIYPAYSINVTVAGVWKYRYRGKSYDLDPGSVTIGFPGDEYWCSHVQAHPNSNFILGLAPQGIDQDPEPLFRTPVMRIPDLASYVARAVACADDEDFHSLIYEIFDMVSHHSYGGKRRHAGAGLRAQRLKRYIERHLSERISLDQLARSVGVNTYTCLRQFKTSTGETPFSYILRCRVARAKALLVSGNQTIEDISVLAGFSSHSYFCRTFKKFAGMSPTEYRATWYREDPNTSHMRST